jgi:hypothetical protein
MAYVFQPQLHLQQLFQGFQAFLERFFSMKSTGMGTFRKMGRLLANMQPLCESLMNV